ncbi:MAG: hypothetical protein ABF888_00095 [Acetobacter papayae]
MTDQKPTGVFVRLPVTDEQAQEMYRAYCAAYARSSLTTRGIATQAALLAVGTPVTGGELEILDIVDAAYGNTQEKYVRQSDAQAQIAALEAEVVRLRSCLEGILPRASTACHRSLSGRETRLLAGHCADAREALKSGAA